MLGATSSSAFWAAMSFACSGVKSDMTSCGVSGEAKERVAARGGRRQAARAIWFLDAPPIYPGKKKGRNMAVGPTDIVLGAAAPDFSLPATDGRTYALKDVAGKKATVIVFICNHCPYVKAVIDRLAADARMLMAEGIGFAAICANDAKEYPEDSFVNMKSFAKTH